MATSFDPFKSKSLWQENKRDVSSFYCPLCQSPRKVPFSLRPLPRHYLQVGLTAAVFMLATWSWFSWKGIVSFLPFWTIFEVVYRARLRASLSCPHCGFDPYLYLADESKARREIEAHWKRKFAEKGIPYPGEAPQPSQPPEAQL